MRVVEAGDILRAHLIEFDIGLGVADFRQPRPDLQQVDVQSVTFPLVRRVLFGVEGGELLEVQHFLFGQQLSVNCAGQAKQCERQTKVFHRDLAVRIARIAFSGQLSAVSFRRVSFRLSSGQRLLRRPVLLNAESLSLKAYAGGSGVLLIAES